MQNSSYFKNKNEIINFSKKLPPHKKFPHRIVLPGLWEVFTCTFGGLLFTTLTRC